MSWYTISHIINILIKIIKLIVSLFLLPQQRTWLYHLLRSKHWPYCCSIILYQLISPPLHLGFDSILWLFAEDRSTSSFLFIVLVVALERVDILLHLILHESCSNCSSGFWFLNHSVCFTLWGLGFLHFAYHYLERTSSLFHCHLSFIDLRSLLQSCCFLLSLRPSLFFLLRCLILLQFNELMTIDLIQVIALFSSRLQIRNQRYIGFFHHRNANLWFLFLLIWIMKSIYCWINFNWITTCFSNMVNCLKQRKRLTDRQLILLACAICFVDLIMKPSCLFHTLPDRSSFIFLSFVIALLTVG